MSAHARSCLLNVDHECGYCTCGADEATDRLDALKAELARTRAELAAVDAVIGPYMHPADTLASRAARIVEQWREGAVLFHEAASGAANARTELATARERLAMQDDALVKAADTFDEMAAAMALLRRDGFSEAMRIAGTATRAVLRRRGP